VWLQLISLHWFIDSVVNMKKLVLNISFDCGTGHKGNGEKVKEFSMNLLVTAVQGCLFLYRWKWFACRWWDITNITLDARFEVFAAVKIQGQVSWVMTPFSDVVKDASVSEDRAASWRWRQDGPPKRCYSTTTLHGVTNKNNSTWT
jgi:hypothetical protein